MDCLKCDRQEEHTYSNCHALRLENTVPSWDRTRWDRTQASVTVAVITVTSAAPSWLLLLVIF